MSKESLNFSDKKAIKWWDRIDSKYFNSITDASVVWDMKKMITGDRSKEDKQKSYSKRNNNEESNTITQGL